MKRLVMAALPLLLWGATALGQSAQWSVDLHGQALKRCRGVRKGDDVHITSIMYFQESDPNSTLIFRDRDHFELTVDGRQTSAPFKGYFHGVFDFTRETTDEIWNAAVIDEILDYIYDNGYRQSTRTEMEFTSMKYEKYYSDYGLILNDPGLVKYINGIIASIIPGSLPGSRPMHFDQIVVKDPAADAFVLPDGTIVINTGLLAALRTRDELAAVLAEEIAHHVMDHQLKNYDRSKTQNLVIGVISKVASEALSSFTPVSVSLGDISISGGSPSTTDISIATGLAVSAKAELGMNYTSEQNMAASDCSVRLMKALGYDPDAPSTALRRLTDMMNRDRKYAKRLQGFQQAELEERIARLGTPHTDRIDPGYEKAVASAITVQAQMFLTSKVYDKACELASINIDNGIYTDDDCMVKAECLLATTDDAESALEVLSLMEKSQERHYNVQTFRYAVLAYIRLGRDGEALAALDTYSSELDKFLKSREDVKSVNIWESVYNYCQREKDWIKRTRAAMGR